MGALALDSFHEYDIRGIYPTGVNEEFYYHLGKSLALYHPQGPISVAYDTRLSSPALSKALIEGITDYGVDVVDIGMISTEVNYFANGKYKFPMSVMITASHNPKEYNGAKIALYSPDGIIPIYGRSGLPEIREFMGKEVPKAQHKGTVTTRNVMNDWITHVLSYVDASQISGYKIVVDTGNGMGGPTWKMLSERLKCSWMLLNNEPDGNFPNHQPDPSKAENREELIATLKAQGADVGIAIDGDADRLFLIDETGTVLSGTVTTALLAAYFLPNNKGVYCYNAICGRIVPEMIRAAGSEPLRTEVGHSFIKNHMRERHAIMAGEHSGHFFFGTNNNSESSAIAALIVIEIMKKEGKKLSELRTMYDRYPVSGEINFRVTDRARLITLLKQTYTPKAESVDELDGVSVWFKDYWFNVRGSNTEPLLRLNVEADTKELLDSATQEITQLLLKEGAERK